MGEIISGACNRKFASICNGLLCNMLMSKGLITNVFVSIRSRVADESCYWNLTVNCTSLRKLQLEK